ncbi:hypothetical protein FKP32DRAFT_1585024 [Trametes sanguinea]|nr:hypothetical protein FKP32DRAFT_1585024 [Trametes sanguinea]
MHAACEGNPAARQHMARMMVQDHVKWGEFWTATEGDELVGFMTWFPPNSELAIPCDERAKLAAPFFASLSEEGKKYIAKVMGEDFPQFVAQCTGTPNGKHDGWWLRIAMTRPDKQGQGVCRKLVEAVRPKVAGRGEFIALSTTDHRNVAIYKALGFELRGFRMFPSAFGEWPLYVFYQKP